MRFRVRTCSALAALAVTASCSARGVTILARRDGAAPPVVDASCALAPPRLIAPLSGSLLASASVALRWQLAPGASGARVELCRDRACTNVLASRVVDEGSGGTVALPASTGALYWRAFARAGAALEGCAPSAAWELFARAGGAPSASTLPPLGAAWDPNADGLVDLAVGSWHTYFEPDATHPAGSNEGLVAVYMGRAGDGPNGTPDVTVHPDDRANDHFGWALASAGDTDGDGFPELLVGAVYRRDAWLLRGSPAGVVSASPQMLAAPADAAWFGSDVAGGDVDDDGYSDAVVGHAFTASNAGGVSVYFGAPDGTAEPARVDLSGADGGDAYFGAAIAAGCDLDGDGVGDLVVGAPGANTGRGRVRVFATRAGARRTLALIATIDPPADPPAQRFGTAVVCNGDLDGDGRADLVIAAESAGPAPPPDDASAAATCPAPDAPTPDGRGVLAFAYPSSALAGAPPATNAARTFVGPERGCPTVDGPRSVAVALVRDVDGDGDDELAVGSPGAGGRSGAAWLFAGRAGGPDTSATARFRGAMGEGLGAALRGAGDVDGDGAGELLVGAPGRNGGVGATYVYRGGAGGLATAPARVIEGVGIGFGGWALARAEGTRAVSSRARPPDCSALLARTGAPRSTRAARASSSGRPRSPR